MKIIFAYAVAAASFGRDGQRSDALQSICCTRCQRQTTWTTQCTARCVLHILLDSRGSERDNAEICVSFPASYVCQEHKAISLTKQLQPSANGICIIPTFTFQRHLFNLFCVNENGSSLLLYVYGRWHAHAVSQVLHKSHRSTSDQTSSDQQRSVSSWDTLIIFILLPFCVTYS